MVNCHNGYDNVDGSVEDSCNSYAWTVVVVFLFVFFVLFFQNMILVLVLFAVKAIFRVKLIQYNYMVNSLDAIAPVP